jgi:PilZ domain-containing protein
LGADVQYRLLRERLGGNGNLVWPMSSKDDIPPLAERRPTPRRRVLLGGVAAYENGAYTLNCQIRDLNEKGARIVVPGRQSLPEELYLVITRDRVAHKAKVIWRKGDEAGLEFVTTEEIQSITDPSLKYLSKILSGQNTACLTWR